MEILTSSKQAALLEYLPSLKEKLADWLFVQIRMHESFDQNLTVTQIAELLNGLFRAHDGRIYVCNKTEILMLLQWSRKAEPEKVVKEIRSHLPAESCEIEVIPGSAKGLARLELLIMPSQAVQHSALYVARTQRQENVILIADDDMYMRTLIKGIMSDVGTVPEVATGDEAENAYLARNPDAIFLDIHLPNRNGHEILQGILKIDPDAYVVMVSSDSSRENVQNTLQTGAKNFLTKPFTRERLLESLGQCSTIS